MSEVVDQYGYGTGYFKPYWEFSPTQLKNWQHKTRYYRMMHRWDGSVSGAWNQTDRGSFFLGESSHWRHSNAVRLHNKRVERKQLIVSRRWEAGLLGSQPRMQPIALVKTYRCKVIGCEWPARRIFTGLHLCPAHITMVKEALK